MPWSEVLRRRRWHKYEHDEASHVRRVWEDHWRGKDYCTLLAEARDSPQFGFITASLPPAGDVLESGCGHGQWLEALARDGLRITGLDRFLGPMQRGLAENPRLRFVSGDISRLPFRDGELAVVLSFGVVEHFEDGCDAQIAEMRRVMAQDGVLFVSVPHHSLVRCVVEPFRLLREGLKTSPALRRMLGRAPLPPRRFYQFAYTTPEFRRLLAAGGFRSEAVLHYDTEFGLTRDYAVMRALRRRMPRMFRGLHAALTSVSTRTCSHMQMHRARKA